MKQWVLIFLIFLAACAPEPPVVEKVVEKVLIQCWDNSTAASIEECPAQPEPEVEEVVEEVPEAEPEVEAAPAVPIAKQLLEDAESKFTSYAYLLSDRIVIVRDDKVRHFFLKMSQLPDRTPITDVYVNLTTKTANAYCNIEREGRIQENSFDYKRSHCKDYLDTPIPVDFNAWNTKGPIDYLEDFASVEPDLIEDNIQTISIGGNSKTIQPSLHYIINGKRTVLRIDRRYGIPIKIEIEGQQAIDYRDTYFDTMIVYGKQEKITKDWLEYQPVSEYWKQDSS